MNNKIKIWDSFSHKFPKTHQCIICEKEYINLLEINFHWPYHITNYANKPKINDKKHLHIYICKDCYFKGE